MTFEVDMTGATVEERISDDEKHRLRVHLATSHHNLLGCGPDSMMAFSPLPENLTLVPFMWLHAIHEANHMGQYRDHEIDDWRMSGRQHGPF